MKKHEFLRELENALKGKLPETDIHEIVSDYNDIFEDGLLENRGEDEISQSIGSPASISKAIIDDPTRNSNTFVGPDISNLAPMYKRLVAHLIDTLAMVLVFTGLLAIIYTPGIGFSHTTITESSTSNSGATDYTQKIYLDNNKITFWDAFIRDFVLKFGISVVTGGILNMVSFIMGSATPDHKTVHDLVAKTKVINIKR